MKHGINMKYSWPLMLAVTALMSSCYFEGATYTGTSSSQNVDIKKAPDFPPDLRVTVSFNEPSGNNALDADETGYITIAVQNTGQGKATGLAYRISPEGVPGLRYPTSGVLGDIAPGSSRTSDIPIHASLDATDQDASLTLTFNEDNSFEPTPVKVNFKVLAMVPPELVVSDVGIHDASGNGMIEPGEVVEVKARIQNVGLGSASDVKASLRLGQNVYFTPDSRTEFNLGDIPSAAASDIDFTIFTNLQATDVPVFVDVAERNGRYAKRGLKLPLVFSRPIQKLEELNVTAKNFPVAGKVPLAAGLTPDVDINIPDNRISSPNAVGLVIGLSDYSNPNIPRVLYAKRDAAIVKEYLVKALGYSPDDILPRDPNELMTAGNMKTLLKRILPSYLKPDGSSDLFIYYSGHGAPNTSTSEPFLVPYDCDPNYVNDDNAYSMMEFYSDIARLRARKKVVVVDACFSGQAGNGVSLVRNASPALLRINNPVIADSNTVVFQSSAASQVSNWYDEKKHGMFTYFFLKGLQGAGDLDGDSKITSDELIRFINNSNDGLPYYSNRLYQRPQEAQFAGSGETIIEILGK